MAKSSLRTIGMVDLHFHGAFGIDLMTAEVPELNELSAQLWKRGVAGFLATTLSVPPQQLLETVSRLGPWIASNQAPGARPLGIHLEGPFISQNACGAHPPSSLRPLTFQELEQLWAASCGTLKLLTIAPETLSPRTLKKLGPWCRKRAIILSMGHSRATEVQATAALKSGFSGVTHAWNALAFHQREAGVLGATLGKRGVHVELILDQVHVAPTVIRWTLALHPLGTCFVSDCVPAASTQAGSWHSFGNLQIQYKEGACRLPQGHLAGGGRLLGDSYTRWLDHESHSNGEDAFVLLKKTLKCLTVYPLQALKLPVSKLSDRKVTWSVAPGGRIQVTPS